MDHVQTIRADATGKPASRRDGEFAAVGRLTVDLARPDIAATGPGTNRVPRRGRRDPTYFDNSILARLLVELHSAHQALAGDNGRAHKFIAQATALIGAEVDDPVTAESCPPGASARGHLAPWQTRRLVEFVEANLAGTIRIEDLARVARLSVSYFSKAFRSDFDESPHTYVVRRRIERAQQMILLSDEPLASIALACGLADQCHLTRLFHRIVGVSPGKWRRFRRHSAPE